MLARWDWGQVDVDLHRRQRFNLAPCPASLPLPQAAGRADAQPTIAPGFADDPFIVVDVGDASHCDHASLQHLCVFTRQHLAKLNMSLTAAVILFQITSPEPAALKEAERLPFHLLYEAKRRSCLKTKWNTAFTLVAFLSNLAFQQLT